MNKKIFLSMFLIIFIIFADLSSKFYVKNLIASNNNETIKIMPLLNFHSVCNYGVSFGMFSKIKPIIIKLSFLIGILLSYLEFI